MLFPYIYVPHSMEKMQGFIDFIFFEVWCKAPVKGSFRFELFDGNAELKGLMESFCYSDTKGGDFFYGHIEGIYNLFVIFCLYNSLSCTSWIFSCLVLARFVSHTPSVVNIEPSNTPSNVSHASGGAFVKVSITKFLCFHYLMHDNYCTDQLNQP